MLDLNHELVVRFKKEFICPALFGKDLDREEYTDETYAALRPFIGDGFELFSGVSKAAIVGPEFAIKVPFTHFWEDAYRDDEDGYDSVCEEMSQDYCALEVSLYNEIADAGYGIFVAETVEIEGTSAILQEKVTSVYQLEPELYNKYKASEETYRRVSEYRHSDTIRHITHLAYSIPMDCLAAFIAHYGEIPTFEFLSWCSDQHPEILDDIHGGNWGFRADGTPAFLDFCGWAR